jgi:L-rhamnose-H+ transport protein
MLSGPALGVFFHWLGGLAAGSFYLPYRGVRKWPWEIYWLIGGFFSWILAPWAFALVMTNDLVGVIRTTPAGVLFWSWFFGLLWGLGGLSFGLSMRYLGMSLGYGVALGTCAVFGTLIPPMVNGEVAAILASVSGRVTLLGIAVCAAGIAVVARAGLSKERELTDEQKKSAVREFNLRKGMPIAVFCGVMSACFAFGLAAAAPMSTLSAAVGTDELWTGLPKLVVILFGGFTSNAIWCTILLVRNRRMGRPSPSVDGASKTPHLVNGVLCALAGLTWYFQFFFYTMGETQMGEYGFSSWTMHMASIIIFSTLWGLALKEWRGTSPRTHRLIAAGVATLVFSTLIVGLGNYLKG